MIPFISNVDEEVTKCFEDDEYLFSPLSIIIPIEMFGIQVNNNVPLFFDIFSLYQSSTQRARISFHICELFITINAKFLSRIYSNDPFVIFIQCLVFEMMLHNPKLVGRYNTPHSLSCIVFIIIIIIISKGR